MNDLLSTPSPPHQLYQNKFAPSESDHSTPPGHLNLLRISTYPVVPVSYPSSTAGRKRKISDDDDLLRPDASAHNTPNHHTTTSPAHRMSSPSPNLSSSTLPRPLKRPRAALATGRPLTLPRLLETLDADGLRHTLRALIEQHPPLAQVVEKAAPRPSVPAALAVLQRYQQRLREAVPFGSHRGSDYAFNRVRPQLFQLRDALLDFAPQFLPPYEPQTAVSLAWLDGMTEVVADLPDWDSWQNAAIKVEAYEDLGRAWVVVLREAAKRAGGVMLQYEGWDRKIRKHNEVSGGKLQEVVTELDQILGWTGAGPLQQQAGGRADEMSSIRQELLSGTYGSSTQVRVGPW